MEDSFKEFLATQVRSAQSPLARGAKDLYTVYRSQLAQARRKENKPTIAEWVTHPACLGFSIARGDRNEFVSAMGLEGEEKDLFFTLVTALRTRGRNLNISSIISSPGFVSSEPFTGNQNLTDSERLFVQYLHCLTVAN